MPLFLEKDYESRPNPRWLKNDFITEYGNKIRYILSVMIEAFRATSAINLLISEALEELRLTSIHIDDQCKNDDEEDQRNQTIEEFAGEDVALLGNL
jgi:hypothetical protein